MKKVILWILGIISLIFLFGCFVYFVWSNQENDFNELKTEIVFIIDNSNLTEYQEDKIINLFISIKEMIILENGEEFII